MATAKFSKSILDQKLEAKKRFKALVGLTEGGQKEEIKQFYTQNYSEVWQIFLAYMLYIDSEAKKKKKTIEKKDLEAGHKVILNLFSSARNIVAKKWQLRSFIMHIERLLYKDNIFAVKKLGFEMLINFVDIMQEQLSDTKVFDLLMAHLDFKPHAEQGVQVKLPTFEVRELLEDEKLRIQQSPTPYTEAESLEFFTMLFSFIKGGDQFDFWWKFFKARIAPILYPNECKNLELLNRLDDMGFVNKCPYKIHLLVLDMILDSLEAPKKMDVLYASDKDIYLFLCIFRQSFLLPPQHFESIAKMLKTYRSYICRDGFKYTWPPIMEKSRNIYFRIFVDNLSQTFFMKGEEQFLDIHVQMCYEVFEIFMHFPNIEDKVDFETWKDLLLALVKIYNHLMQRCNSEDSYNQTFGKLLERTCIRNLLLLWVKAHPAEEYTELWSALYALLQTYFSVDSVFYFWRATILNLSSIVCKNIFNVPEDNVPPYIVYDTELYEFTKKAKALSTEKKIKWTGKQHNLKLEEYLPKNMDMNIVLHLWHKMLSMYGDDNAMKSSAPLHTNKIKVISEVIDIFLKISNIELKAVKGATPPSFLHSPEANRLLDLFAEWLVEACDRQDQLFVEGRLSAYVSFCKIICQKCSQPIKKRYLAEFYRVVHIGLSNLGNLKIIEGIILNSRTLFSLGYPGVNSLIPDYVRAIEPLLKDNSQASEPLRIASIHVLSSILSIAYFYRDAVFPSMEPTEEKKQEDPADEKTGFRALRRLRVKLCQILLGAVQDNRSPECQIKCLWALVMIIQKELTQPQKTSPTSLKFIVDGMLGFLMHSNEKVAIASHNAFIALAHLNLLPDIGEAIVKSIIVQICQVITSTLNEGKLTRGAIVTHLFYTLVEIIVYVPKTVLEMSGVGTAIFEAISVGVACDKSSSSPGEKPEDTRRSRTKSMLKQKPTERSVQVLKDENAKNIAEAAEVLLVFILNILNNFPVASGSAVMSSQFTELSYLKEESGLIQPDPRIHHFIFNNYSLLTVIENPDVPESVKMIVRDMTGKYSWEQKLSMTEAASMFKKIAPEGARSLGVTSTPATPRKELSSPSVGTPSASPAQEQAEEVAPEEELPPAEPEQVPEEVQEAPEEIEELPTPAQEGGAVEEVNEAPQEEELPVPSEDFYELPTPGEEMYQQGSEDGNAEEAVAEEVPEESHHTTVAPATEDHIAEQHHEDVPHLYDPRIDTDQTDMLELLQHYVSEKFTLCAEYEKNAVVFIPEQNIDINEVTKSAQEQSNSEKQLTTEGPFIPFEQSILPAKQDAAAFRAFRALMNNYGLLSPMNRVSIARLEANHKLYRCMKQLDKVAERETIKVGVIYVKNDQEKEKFILKNDSGSDSYNEFLQTLGWDVDLKTHKGFLGGLDNSVNLTTGLHAPYYANPTTEVIYHVVTNMPTKPNDSQQIHKKRHVGNDFVHIVWSENDRDYRPWTIVSQFNFVHIVIYPLKDPLFRVQIFTKPEVPVIGPLLDGMIVDKMSLGPLVRLTAINANKAVRYNQQGYKKPYPTRKDLVNEISERFKVKTMSNEDFLKPLFFDQGGKLSIVTNLEEDEPVDTTSESAPATSVSAADN